MGWHRPTLRRNLLDQPMVNGRHELLGESEDLRLQQAEGIYIH